MSDTHALIHLYEVIMVAQDMRLSFSKLKQKQYHTQEKVENIFSILIAIITKANGVNSFSTVFVLHQHPGNVVYDYKISAFCIHLKFDISVYL